MKPPVILLLSSFNKPIVNKKSNSEPFSRRLSEHRSNLSQRKDIRIFVGIRKYFHKSKQNGILIFSTTRAKFFKLLSFLRKVPIFISNPLNASSILFKSLLILKTKIESKSRQVENQTNQTDQTLHFPATTAGLSLNFLNARLKREEMGSEVPSSCTLDLHSRNGRACAGKG